MNLNSILVAEDDSDDQMIFKSAVTEILGTSNVTFFSNGKELLSYLNQLMTGFPCCIFLDLDMPEMNGIETLQIIKEQQAFRHLPVYILSGSQEPGNIASCKNNGAADFIEKQDSFAKLKSKLETVLANYFPILQYM